MLRNYFLVTLRTILRNKLFSLITICGLAIAATASFALYQYVLFESGYDRTTNGHIYRVPIRYLRGESVDLEAAANVSAAGPTLKENFPEVINYARMVKTSLFTSSLTKAVVNSIEFSRTTKGNFISFNEDNVYMADAPLLTMFSFPLLEGSPATALKEPNTVVITESIAKKYFGSEQALGQSLMLNREMSLVVTGVLKDLPENSHLKFDILISYSTLKRSFDGDSFWGWSVFYTYIELDPKADPSTLESKFTEVVRKYSPDFSDNGEYHNRFFLQPVADIHLHPGMYGEQSPVSDERTVYFLSALAVLILFIAWINYVNLSTAKALERAKEVGLRKVVGASRQQLIFQFFTDAIVINMLAAIIAIVLTTVIWPSFQDFVGKKIPIALFSSIKVAGLLVVVFLIGIVGVGSYPALILSSFNPAIVLKGKFLRSSSGSMARKAMIAFQYFIALSLMAGTLLLYRQLAFMQSQDTGYSKDQIIVVEGPAVYDSTVNRKVNLFKNALMQVPGIRNVGASANIPGQLIQESGGFARMGSGDDNWVGSLILGVDTSFLSTYGIKIVEGRKFTDSETMTFRRPKEPEMIRIVVNEEFVRRMGGTVGEALHQQLRFGWGPEERNAEIIGVVADHHQLSLKDPIQPIVYMQPQWTTWKYFSIKVSNSNSIENETIIKQTFKKIFPDNSFVSFYLDDYYNKQYSTDQKMGQLVGIFTALAIVVTCLGLIGLTVFSVSQRTKEIGIRKVMGAPVAKIIYLFSQDLIKILIGAYIVAVPLILFGGKKWLAQFAFVVGIEWIVLAIPLILLLLTTILVVASICFRRAVESPVKALKYE